LSDSLAIGLSPGQTQHSRPYSQQFEILEPSCKKKLLPRVDGEGQELPFGGQVSTHLV
jgi:hypothetical protein